MKKNLNKIVISLGLAIGISPCVSADIAADAVLLFSEGITSCILGADPSSATGCLYDVTKITGSYFGMDTSGDGIIQEGEKTPLTATDGITIGTAQAPGSIDASWSFGGSSGNHLTNQGLSVTGTGNTASLDMTGWTVFWGGGYIDMGAGTTGDLGSNFAMITCAIDCTRGKSFVLDYKANVPTGSFAGFFYTLHLEGSIDYRAISISLNVQGGRNNTQGSDNIQECTILGGANVTINTNIFVDSSELLSNVKWSVDGNEVGTGESLSYFYTLGSHEITATATTDTGGVATDSVKINVVDTVAPVITSVGFTNRFTGLPITTLEQYNLLEVDIKVDEACDPSPFIQAVRGTATNNGDIVWLFTYNSQILTWQNEMFLMAVAKDQSNNMSSKITSNPIYAP